MNRTIRNILVTTALYAFISALAAFPLLDSQRVQSADLPRVNNAAIGATGQRSQASDMTIYYLPDDEVPTRFAAAFCALFVAFLIPVSGSFLLHSGEKKKRVVEDIPRE